MRPLFPFPPSTPRHFRQHSFSVVILVLLILPVLAPAAVAQQTAADSLAGSALCTFDDGKQLSTRFKPVAVRTEGVPYGKVWAPGGLAMTLFTEVEVTIGSTSVSPGAYTMYLLPGKKDWTLIVSRNVTIDSPYDRNLDLLRASMQIADRGRQEEQLQVFFGHTGPKRCEINVDYAKSRAWLDFAQK